MGTVRQLVYDLALLEGGETNWTLLGWFTDLHFPKVGFPWFVRTLH